MSYGGYQQYGGNPYEQSGNQYAPTAGAGYGASSPYATSTPQHEAGNPINGPTASNLSAPPLNHETSNYSQPSQYSGHGAAPTSATAPAPLHHGAEPLSREDFLARIEGTKSRIGQLTTHISNVASIHQRLLSSPDSTSSAQLENIVTQTQVLNTTIKDEIKFLEKDASRQPNSFKNAQVSTLKRNFQRQLEDFQKEERDYEHRYREAIARQYRIVNPDATEQEINEAADANWGDEGVFQTALKSNRSGQASSVLGAVRARHNDIQRIEKTLGELALLFQQLNEAVVYQEPQVVAAEEQTHHVKDDTEQANTHLNKGIASARRARKLKWWTLGICVLIVLILALVLGLYFGLPSQRAKHNSKR